MEFQSYVPNAVRVSLATLLEGDGRQHNGWIAALSRADTELILIQQRRDEWLHDAAESDALRVEHAEATERRDRLAADISCCQRLAHDARMQEAYAQLVSLPNVTDSNLSGFIYAAWAARMDYTKHRAKAKAANELAHAVAKAAGALANLLLKAEGFGGTHLPSGFFSIQSLLEKTEHDYSDRDFFLWQDMRRVFGETEPIDPAEAAWSELPDALGTAPSMARIIATMQQEAVNYAAAHPGHIAAALATRQHGNKPTYLRAFGALLRDVHRMEPTTATINAMATTATVVLNDPDDAVTCADVRNALGTIASPTPLKTRPGIAP